MAEPLPEEALRAFLGHVEQLSADAGVELDDDEKTALFEEAVDRGFTPEATAALFDETYGFDDDEPEYLTRAEFEAATQAADEEDDEMFDDDEEALSPGTQRLADDLQTDLDRLESKLARPLLASESEAFVRSGAEQVNRTGAYSIAKAHDAAGAKSYGEMSRSEINDAMVERARDLDPQDDTEKVYEIGSDDRMVRHQAWTDYMVERVNGASEDDFTDVEIDGDEAA